MYVQTVATASCPFLTLVSERSPNGDKARRRNDPRSRTDLALHHQTRISASFARFRASVGSTIRASLFILVLGPFWRLVLLFFFFPFHILRLRPTSDLDFNLWLSSYTGVHGPAVVSSSGRHREPDPLSLALASKSPGRLRFFIFPIPPMPSPGAIAGILPIFHISFNNVTTTGP
ncbi:hypothetical protein VTJ04DRAFT_3383 [Mycothermus thermophilus]|uniref:uncharacterized protein n=1 Tax=Humicola insolens TaxID=85995 RepID=UPI003742D534